MKTLVVDCGATKTDWALSDGSRVRTPGFNLAHTPQNALEAILDDAASRLGDEIGQVYFYAAGLVGEPPVNLGRWFPAAKIEYASDMLGAARALFGRSPGIAVILGTGANTCQYNGSEIQWKVDCGGFILGDEGSGSVLGRRFISDYLRGLVPEDVALGAGVPDYVGIVNKVYAQPAPARWLGEFAPYLLSRYNDSAYVKELVDDNFRGLFRRCIKRYDALPVGIVGGFGWAAKEILERIATEEGFKIEKIEKTPLEGLLDHHAV